MRFLGMMIGWMEQLSKKEMLEHVEGVVGLFWETFVELVGARGSLAQ